jgi:hypothetical protein
MLINPKQNGTFIEDVVIKLFAFMRQGGIKCVFQKDEGTLFAYTFEVRDMTEDGTPIGMAFKIDSTTIADVENTPESIENFCLGTAMKVGHMMLQEKLSKLLVHVEKSKLYVPGKT